MKPAEYEGKTNIYLNGKLVGFHDNPQELVRMLRQKRRQKELPFDTSIALYEDTNEIYVNADEGRALRPLIVVENGKPKLTQEHLNLLKEGKMKFSDLVRMGVTEFLDAEEEENAFIAMNDADLTPKHTHLEIHPALMLGSCASVCPFPEHNSAPRVTMATAMIKQALGIYCFNFNHRTDTQSHILHYPQNAIVETKYADTIGLSNKAAGQNFVVALTPYFGFNINDAIVLNRSSIERGLARTTYYRTYEVEERKYPGGQKDRFEKPKAEIAGYRGDEAYRFLDEDGIIEPEFKVSEMDVLVGKTSPPRFLEEVSEFGVLEEKRRENSEAVRPGESGIIDRVMFTEGEGGNRLVKIKTRANMIPEVGDKFAARHGQKGVVGLIADGRDMPFSESGIQPDLCMNPHSIPARMTVGYLLETLGSKVGALSSRRVDATIFDNEKEDALRKELASHGFKQNGEEALYDGVTGERIEAKIFTGIVYYQRLKHLVANKIHARGRGPVQILTRQPTEGRAREGGLRVGEMERDCLISHGASLLLMERLLEESDKVVELVCAKCGMPAIDDQIRRTRYCPVCGDTNVHPIEVSHAFKLLMNELRAMGISPKIRLEDKV